MLTLRPRARACVLVALAAALAGCGETDAEDEPFVGTHLYQDTMGSFELRLLVPPWIPPVVYMGQTFSVVTPMNATITADPTVLLSEALYSLQVSPMIGDPTAAMQAIQVTLPGTAATAPGESVLTASGATGVEMAWEESPAVFHRDAFVARTGTATYRLHFTAKKDIADEAMVAQMIASFTPEEMTMLGRLSLVLVLLAGSRIASAQAQNDPDDIDDPKMARRLGTRIWWGTPPPPAPAPATVPAATAAAAATASAAPTARDVDGGVPTLARTAEPPPAAASAERVPPRLKLNYRRFNFVQIGASSSINGAVATEPFHSIGVDVYPLTSLLRIGLSTQYGWQSGGFVSNGDYFAAQSLSIGAQYLEAGRFVPFAEAFGGIGYMRRLQFDRTVPTVYWQLGVDVGTEIYFARAGFISLAIGYLRPVNGFARVQQFETVFVDTWSFKLGIGI